MIGRSRRARAIIRSRIPIVAATSTDPQENPINGHEQLVMKNDDLQYACIFPLSKPRDCTTLNNANDCDCNAEDSIATARSASRPRAERPRTTQYFAKAYPGLRLLDVARQLDTQSAVASICPRNSLDVEEDDYGYYAALRALQARLAPRLVQ